MDARRTLLVLRRWWPLLLAGTLLAAVVAFAVTRALPPAYQATTFLRINPGLGTPSGGLDAGEVSAASSQATEDMQLIHTLPIAQATLDRVSGRLHHAVSAKTLLKNAQAIPIPPSLLISLVVQADNPADAQLLANTMASVFIAREAHDRSAQFTAALAEINRQIYYYSHDQASAQQQNERLLRLNGNLTPAQQSQSSLLLQRINSDQTQLQQLQQDLMGIRLRQAGNGTLLSIAQPATLPPDPVSSHAATNTAVAAVLVFCVLLAIVLLADVADTRPRTPADIAARLDLPLLGTIGLPATGGAALPVLQEPASAQADEYRLLRADLGLGAMTDVEASPARVLVVTGTGRSAGATSVAANLAAVAARAGSRVTLVEANLRQPALHMLLGVPERGGLAAALRDGDDLESLVQESGLPGLRVLTAGHGAAGAIDLLGSARMRAVLSSLRARNDLLVVDTAVATSPDAAVLAPLADTTVLVARLHAAGRDDVDAAGQRLRLAGAHLGGVVVTLSVPTEPAGRAVRRGAARETVEAPVPARTDLRNAK